MTHTWTIIGGGIQGITTAVHLLEHNIVSVQNLRIIDPHGEPLAQWRFRTNRIEMPYLRSSFVHHLSSKPFTLENHAEGDSPFLGRYKRPERAFFHEYCEQEVKRHKLDSCFIKDSVTGLKKNATWEIELASGETMYSDKVVLALGAGQKLSIPACLKPYNGQHVHHIFDTELDLESMEGKIAIIGGGITSAHTAALLSNRYPGQVTLSKRHAFRVHAFDSNPGWLGPKKMSSFKRVESYQERRSCIHEARNRGSITRDLLFKLRKLEREQKLEIITEEWTDVTRKDGRYVLFNEQTSLEVDHIVCCTGFEPVLPGKEWLQATIDAYSLPCAQCGFPILTSSLMWAEDLYAVGALAELEIGPVARNISGAQRAASRIVESQLA
ncbi:FAD/NAD(P)-binding protein [Paenalkalicoccus suaedae]|uniref:FAD/NAD(P)-binding protein n=1 Tax=Paenalkalicoccus suaedae TaxID=2592382 RepID=A0A859FGG1_9BACI|nr:FAD/NAD(P)-binding protein [Paenalkalicoccus suaedae]QKS72219.1 FAD/NAD(P)-binding protein [Paenalkalicoccus suaedae]